MVARYPIVCILLAWTLLPPLSGQETLEPLAVFRTDSRLVVLNVSVFDRDGKVVRGLPQSAFRVFEDGAPQKVSVFRQEDVPVSLGLIIDSSASMGPKRERVAAAALDMVRASNPEDEVFVVHFNTDAVISQEFTSDIGKLETSLRNFDTRNETAMRDALRLALEHLKARGSKDKKVLLVVTDGDDNASVESQEHLVQVAQRYDTLVYGIGLLGGELLGTTERVRKALDEVTLATGGRSWYPDDASEMAKLTPEIAHEIRSQYIVGYTPSNKAADGGFRRVRAEVNVPGVTVRTRSGYYAPQR
jgi:Ca-activated chloride channel homolog